MPLTKTQVQSIKTIKDPQLQQRFLFLFSYPRLKAVLFADKTTQTVEAIVKKHSLSSKQHIALSKIVMQVLSGELALDKVAGVLTQRLGTSPQISQQIIEQINQEIFEPVKQELVKAYQDIESGVAGFSLRRRRLKPATPGAPRTPEESTPPPQAPPLQPQPPSLPRAPEPAIPSPLAETIEEPVKPSVPNWQTVQQRTKPAPTNLPAEKSPSPTLPLKKGEGRLAKDIRTLAKQNPKILDQQITANYLKEAGTGRSIPPTVKNWLLDYTKIAGATKHSSLDRGRYLFKSPNAKNLSESEKQILGRILESYDEITPLKTEPETGLLSVPKRQNDFRPQRSDEIRTFQVQPISFGNIVDLQDI